MEAMIPSDLKSRVDSELEPGERIVWIEVPIPRYFTGASTAVFLFAIPWTAFSIFWMFGAAGFQIPDFSRGGFALFPLFGLPFFLIGLAMLSVPLWTRRSAGKTVYAITNRRAITLTGLWSTTVRSFPPERLKDLSRKERRDGTGDVVIAHFAWRDSDGDKRSEELGFLGIRNPKEAEQMLRKLATQGTL